MCAVGLGGMCCQDLCVGLLMVMEGWIGADLDLPCLRRLTPGYKPRRGVGGSSVAAGGQRHITHTLAAAGGFRGGVAGAEPPHKGGPNRPDRPELQ